MARETWTDERLDDLAQRVDRGFDAAKVEIRDLRTHTDKGFEEVKGEIREQRIETKTEFRDLRAEMNARFDSGQKTMILGFASIVASVLGALVVA